MLVRASKALPAKPGRIPFPGASKGQVGEEVQVRDRGSLAHTKWEGKYLIVLLWGPCMPILEEIRQDCVLCRIMRLEHFAG